ncbi:MAG: transglycosylase domain-containing protein [Balneolales bacterium]
MHSKPRPRKPRYLRYIAEACILPVIILLTFILLIWAGAFGSLPGEEELNNIRHHEASQVYSADGEMLGTYFVQNRAKLDLDEVPSVFLDALLATEDVRFYQHDGVDRRAMMRVMVRTLLMGQDTGGGSTITQQLAKNLYPRKNTWRGGLVVDKIKEIITARKLERIYTKGELLELYLNTVSFGEETFGLEMAARRYFNTSPAELQLHEAATLTGLLKATSWYNPRRFPDRALARRNVVLRQMERYDKITPEDADSTAALPISLNYSRITANDGPAPHFREHLRMELHRVLANEPALDGKSYSLYTDGLRIETTLDSRVQSAAEEAVGTHMAQLQADFNRQLSAQPIFEQNGPAILSKWEESAHYKSLKKEGLNEKQIYETLHTPVPMDVFTWEGEQERTLSPHDSISHYLSFLNTGFFAMEPKSGRVQAWVGGINHRYFRYDHVKAQRQPGSAFKPVVYASALESGAQPCDYQRNRLSTYAAYEEWTPRNSQDEYGGYYSLQNALARSVNTIAVDLLMDIGIGSVRNTATGMGITSPIPFEPSIALGTAELSLLELTSAYTSFVNRGVPASPHYLEAIYNAEGDLIYDFTNPNMAGDRDAALSEGSAAAMVHMLSKAVDEGTGKDLRDRFRINHALAGKTGTTQHGTDGWFVGMTPDMVFGSWVGGWSPRVRFKGNMGYGSKTALPIVGHFLNNLDEEPDLGSQPDHFYPYQLQTNFKLDCADERDDRFRDKVRKFFTGESADEPRRVEEEKESRSFRDRVLGLFGRD